MKNKETRLQIAISDWLRLQYPELIFTSSLDGAKLTIGQAMRAKRMRSDKGMPDLQIFQPNSLYHGLFIELKIESPYKKDGLLKKNEHLREQQNMINKLNNRGYFACFAWSFEQAVKIINQYLEL